MSGLLRRGSLHEQDASNSETITSVDSGDASDIEVPFPTGVLPSGARYLCHVEDDPMIWHKECSDWEDAFSETADLVAERFRVNGAGCGTVLDTWTDTILVLFEETEIKPPPGDPEEVARIVNVVRGWSSGSLNR